MYYYIGKLLLGGKQQSQHLVYQSYHHRIICFTIKHITTSNLYLAAKLITPSIKNQYKMARPDIFSRLQRNISKTSVDEDPSTQRDDKDNSDVPSPIRLSKSEDESSVEGNSDEDKPPTSSAKSNSDEDKPTPPMKKRRPGDRLARVGLRELGEKGGKNIKEGLTVAGENVKEGMTVAGENVKEGMTEAGEKAGNKVKEGLKEAGEKAGNKVKEGLKEGLKDMSITINFSTNTLGLANKSLAFSNKSLALAKKGLTIFLIVNFMWVGLFLIWLYLKLFKYL